jgi:hypothetical protein
VGQTKSCVPVFPRFPAQINPSPERAELAPLDVGLLPSHVRIVSPPCGLEKQLNGMVRDTRASRSLRHQVTHA